ncbi:MAG: alpha/beta fold hydrolase [Cytophagales bacterium]|nr:alpha/beta fold hydrolase [Rhizobacter sp.]
MLARLQQFVTVSLLISAVLWATWFAHLGHPVWAVAGTVLIVLGYALFLAIEFVLLWFVHGDDPAPKATVLQLLKAWLGEVHTAPRVFCWQQPFRSNREPDFLPAEHTGRGVVLVHGFVCNRGLWNRWAPRFREQGVPFVAVNLEPVFGTISDYAPIVEQAVRRLEQATGQAPVLVGHSMGGLAIRAWIAAFNGSERVHRVITIGSPHRGTWLGRFGTTQNAREMALGTDWQRALETRESAEHFERFTCFYSHCDNIVFPASNATLPGADNRHLTGIAHVHLLDHPEVLKEVVAWAKPALSVASGEAAALTR